VIKNSIESLMNFLGCNKASVHNYKKRGLPFYRVGRKVLFKKEEVLVFMKDKPSKKKNRVLRMAAGRAVLNSQFAICEL
jgi:hypothetical protein